MTNRMREQRSASSFLRVSVACFRWNGDGIETIITPECSLPSATPTPHEPLDITAERIISEYFGSQASYTEQLYTFDVVNGDDREINVTYLALFSPASSSDSRWVALSNLKDLPNSTTEMLEYANTRLRAKLEYTGIVFHLLPESFTIAAVQLAYESILGAELDKRNFRRRMTSSGMLEATGDKLREGPHRPAALYRFSGLNDRSSYLTPETSATDSRQESTT